MFTQKPLYILWHWNDFDRKLECEGIFVLESEKLHYYR